MNIFERYEKDHQFKVGWCPVCNQDWQVILKNPDGTLAIVCLECLSRWLHPEDAKEHQKVAGDFILKKGEELYDYVPTHQQIIECGWDKFLIT